MKRITAMICLAAILLCGCGAKQEETTTITGIVTAVDGTQVTVMNLSGNASQRPQRQEGQEGNRPEGGFGGQMPNFQGGGMPTLPEGETMPDFGNFEGFNGQMPNFGDGEMPTMPESFDGQMPNFGNGERPTMPEGETRPQGGGRGEGFSSNVETTTVDLKDAHITVEFDGGKATGSMEDIKQGVSVTITLTDGKATHVLVAESSGFGGFGNFGGGKWQGNFGGNRNPGENQVPQSTQGVENA